MYSATDPEPAKSSTWPKRRVSLRSSSPNPLLQTPKSPDASRYVRDPSAGVEAASQSQETKNPPVQPQKPREPLHEAPKSATRSMGKGGAKESAFNSRKPVLTIPIPPPPLVRKKSGEVVKSALKGRTRSMPTTPTKFVHFGVKLEHVKLFQKEQKPESISNPVSDDEDDYSSDEDGEYVLTIRLPNFPPPIFSRSIYNSKTISVDKILLSEDKQDLMGTVQIQNLSFRKVVAIRYTFDFWKTVEEVVADYKDSPVRPCPQFVGIDRFTFTINLENRITFSSLSPKKTMFFAVRYQVNNQEFWDNNDGMNYQVDLVYSKPYRFQAWPFDLGTTKASVSPDTHEIAQPRNPLYAFGSPETPSFLSLHSKNLGSRYDFGVSLSATVQGDATFEKIPTKGASNGDEAPDANHDLRPKSSLSSLFAHPAHKSYNHPNGGDVIPWDEQPATWNGYDNYTPDYFISSPSTTEFTNPVPIPPRNNSPGEDEQSYSGLYSGSSFGNYSTSPVSRIRG
ncbi:hypothetical protein K493DRAFT_317304 [Basidiobolus meristosporus CBS 931.73]|uniref:CBM21 domain-containing protein n=1 Tax=Basidiobolus meristosporus CBS 931.73 TaxID=1314790 RepID=A0A1Y1Y0X6_9FUNG|nr:hypothetical protein K493DRAFT_317304 [Basidiobolus meristosporus CBS 931.73]|eukprot:ORX91366.1 hypothetical protein K493DRAFT_317304 [Basidiobolus meristosporus CBS 931.73]